MLGTVLNYAVSFPERLADAILRDPADMFDKLYDHLVQQWEYRNPVHPHAPSPDWERELHHWLGIGDTCEEGIRFRNLWPQVLERVRQHGIVVGPESFAGFNDGDAALLRAIWCIVRHLKPTQIVETGVGHGFTSRFILEAIGRNKHGRLFSIDRPALDPTMRERVGIAVPERMRNRWQLISGSSRRCLPPLLSQLGAIDLFVHDSLHTERNVRFELDRAWAALRPGGLMVVDDVDSNGGLASFRHKFSAFRALICEAEPVRPDERRFNKKGLFAIIMKDA